MASTSKVRNSFVRLENTEGNHFKFWAAIIRSRVIKVSWGRIGSYSKSKKYSFDTNEDAMDFFQNKIERKLGRGYRNVSVPAGMAA